MFHRRNYRITLGEKMMRELTSFGWTLLHDWQFLITSEYQVRHTPSVFIHTQQIFRMNEMGEGHIKRVCATEQTKHKSVLLLVPGSPYTLPLAHWSSCAKCVRWIGNRIWGAGMHVLAAGDMLELKVRPSVQHKQKPLTVSWCMMCHH